MAGNPALERQRIERKWLDSICREWRSSYDAERAFDRSERRNHLLRSQLGNITPGYPLLLLEVQGYKCASCGTSIQDRKSYEVDHIIPLSRGGLHDDLNPAMPVSDVQSVEGREVAR